MDATVADRLEIRELVDRYAIAFDRRDWDAVEAVFTDDAIVDYSDPLGFVGSPAEFVAVAAGAIAGLAATQHHNTSHVATVDGDTAEAVTYLASWGAMLDGGRRGGEAVSAGGAFYVDRFRRTAAGWRISHRQTKNVWVQDYPEGMPTPAWYGTTDRNIPPLP